MLNFRKAGFLDLSIGMYKKLNYSDLACYNMYTIENRLGFVGRKSLFDKRPIFLQ